MEETRQLVHFYLKTFKVAAELCVHFVKIYQPKYLTICELFSLDIINKKFKKKIAPYNWKLTNPFTTSANDRLPMLSRQQLYSFHNIGRLLLLLWFESYLYIHREHFPPRSSI